LTRNGQVGLFYLKKVVDISFHSSSCLKLSKEFKKMANQNILDVIVNTRKEVITNSRDPLDILLRIRANETGLEKRTPLAISLVIDRSGSMSGRRLEEAKKCALDLLNRLHDSDKISVVIYDDYVTTLLELMNVGIAKSLLPMRLNNVVSNGCTNLHGGWLKGAETLAPLAGKESVCRVILLSDGQANAGLTNVDQIASQVKDLAIAGVTTTTVGIGEGFNETLMTAMANAGQGNAWYGQRVEDLQESFDAELSYLSHIIWKNIRVGISSQLTRVKVHNDYVKNEQNQYCLPSIAIGTEVWLGLSVPMREVVMMQDEGQHIVFNIKAMDENDIEHSFMVQLPKLEVVTPSEYQQARTNVMVVQRFQEIEIADIQKEINRYVELRDWQRVEEMIADLKLRAQDNPWLEKSISYIEKLVKQRNYEVASKELSYSSRSMKMRTTERDEMVFQNRLFENEKQAYLRRKSSQGRNSESQEE